MTDRPGYIDASGRAAWTVRLSWLLVVIYPAISIILLYDPEYSTWINRPVAPQSELVDIGFFIALIASMLLFFAQVLVYMMWLYRTARNVRAMGIELKTSPGWAVGWNFVPLFLYWKPFQAVRDIWRASLAGEEHDGVSLPGYFGTWWTLCVIASILSTYQLRIEPIEMEPQTLTMLTVIDIAITTPTFWLTARVVRAITLAQGTGYASSVFD